MSAHEAVYDDVVQRLAEAARGTTVGPLISDGQRARVVTLLVAGLRQDDEAVAMANGVAQGLRIKHLAHAL